ncbi:cyclic peptide export ABC transporter [Oscillatoria salina]|uniref:cyclic peptide export ABC transporter n=1 Tax=Oscillatoria salina TaxID=331517 RepID=UPI0013BC470F|nr:cyclic peptide export ABC transporter [Oscillatoria salina]MBZ8181920.1 cyclic peptide export ABC transporter [Oscillatoria salina IIICB1]NET89796.1 cyclic peptide export ABC transporter [Kamptonema sp. SIO1D9]
MTLIYLLLGSSWQMVAIAIATGFLSGGSSAALIALMSQAVGKTTPSVSLAWGFAGLAIAALLSSIITRVLLIRLSQDAIYQLQLRLSRQILASELSHLERLGSPRLLATLTEDVQVISDAVYVLPFLCINVAIVVGCLVYITWLSWQVMAIITFLSGFAIATAGILLKRGRKLLAQARQHRDRLFQHFQTITAGIKELKLHSDRRQDFFQQDLEATAAECRRDYVRGLTLFATNDSWGKSIFFFAIGIVLFALPHYFTIDLQILSAYVLTFTFIIGPLENIVNKLPLITKASIALEKIEALNLSLASSAETAANNQLSQINHTWHFLELKDVTYTYYSESEDTNFTLGPLNLKLTPGELIFIIGGNGSGKSTFAKLLTGLYLPDTGIIQLDANKIDSHNREWYRQHFTVIFSDFYLFDRLLGFSQPNLEAKAQAYLKQLQLDRKVKIEQGKLSTTALSQGQRKRLALLTAYLEDRPIYLFDEWAADQDPIFKEIFYTELLPRLQQQGKTVIAIAHDDRYFSVASRLIKLEYGKILYDKVIGN